MKSWMRVITWSVTILVAIFTALSLLSSALNSTAAKATSSMLDTTRQRLDFKVDIKASDIYRKMDSGFREVNGRIDNLNAGQEKILKILQK